LDCVALAAALQAEESSRQQQQEQALPEGRQGAEERRRRALAATTENVEERERKRWRRGLEATGMQRNGEEGWIYTGSLRPVRGNCNGQSGSKTNNPTVANVVPQV